jgi:hypothetical protein
MIEKILEQMPELARREAIDLAILILHSQMEKTSVSRQCEILRFHAQAGIVELIDSRELGDDDKVVLAIKIAAHFEEKLTEV